MWVINLVRESRGPLAHPLKGHSYRWESCSGGGRTLRLRGAKCHRGSSGLAPVARLPRCFRAGEGPRAQVPRAGRHFAGGLAGHALSPPTFPRPFRPTRRGCQGIFAGSGKWCDGGRTGVFRSGFSRAAGFAAELPIGFGGSSHPCPPGEDSGPRVWSGQAVWGPTSF
jgi:hypothetical protein